MERLSLFELRECAVRHRLIEVPSLTVAALENQNSSKSSGFNKTVVVERASTLRKEREAPEERRRRTRKRGERGVRAVRERERERVR